MTHPTLLIATRNPGKLFEVQSILRGLAFEFRTLAEFGDVSTPQETGKTFAENASLKARRYATDTGLLSLADDSGLEVDALGGAPGLLSARVAGNEATDTERVSLLLSKLLLVPEERRTARFVCVVAVSDAHGTLVHSATGICRGSILSQRRGSGGFGYDPVFVPQGRDLTLAQLDPQIKNQISHRAKALLATREFLLKYEPM